MRAVTIMILGGSASLAALVAHRARAATSSSGQYPTSSTSSPTSMDSISAAPSSALLSMADVMTRAAQMFLGWWPPAAAAPYLASIAVAEHTWGLPKNLLARVLHQESRYRPEIIDGRVVSPAGAKGIAQIVPRWHPGVNPLDPFQAIAYAARYLAEL